MAFEQISCFILEDMKKCGSGATSMVLQCS